MSEPIARIGRARDDEPAVTHPSLLAMVEAARSQPLPRLAVDARAVTAAWNERKAQRRRMLAIAAAAGIGALALASLIGKSGGEDKAASSHEVATAQEREGSDASGGVTIPSEPAAAKLAHAVRVEPIGEVDLEVTSPWSIDVRSGAVRLTVDDRAVQPLSVGLPDGALEIKLGIVRVEVAGHVSTVDVEWGKAVRTESDGRKESLHPAAPAATGPTASELAALAEARMAVGDRAAAIKHLSQLVRRHPKSAPARAALLDLARMLKATGRGDEARCAYRLYLEREPKSTLRAEVERALAGLGEGPGCRGLKVTG